MEVLYQHFPVTYQNCTSNFVKRWYRSISIRKWNDTMMPGPYIPQKIVSAPWPFFSTFIIWFLSFLQLLNNTPETFQPCL